MESFGQGCVYEDICSIPDTSKPSTQPSSPPCDGAKWHPDESNSKCTNSHDFPSQWSSSESLLFDTAQSCCQIHFFAVGKSCDIVDICAQDDNPYARSSPTNSPTDTRLSALCEEASEFWHPTKDKLKCSNR